MSDLSQHACVPCEQGGDPMDVATIEKMLPQVKNWQWIDRGQVDKLSREFKFKNFVKALKFANSVGEIAEQQGHHPKLIIEWGKVVVIWWTHAVKGLHRNDFIMAAKTGELYQK